MPKMKPRFAVEVYTNTSGYVCIRQQDDNLRTDETILLEPSQVPVVIEWLQAEFAAAAATFSPIEYDADESGAPEPQRTSNE